MSENKINDGGPAFPCSTYKDIFPNERTRHSGLSLRDYFAAKANEEDIQAVLFIHTMKQVPLDENQITISRQQARYIHADAMLKAREK